MGGDAPYDSPLNTMTVAAKGTLVCLTVERHAASTLLGSLQVCVWARGRVVLTMATLTMATLTMATLTMAGTNWLHSLCCRS